MSLSKQTFHRLCQLAMLDDAHDFALLKRLNAVQDVMHMLLEVDTGETDPLTTPFETTSPLREDDIVNDDLKSPSDKNYCVPLIIETSE